MKRSGGLRVHDQAACVTVSISVLIHRPYQTVYLALTGWWGLTLQISTLSNFPFDLSVASLVCVSQPAGLNSSTVSLFGVAIVPPRIYFTQFCHYLAAEGMHL